MSNQAEWTVNETIQKETTQADRCEEHHLGDSSGLDQITLILLDSRVETILDFRVVCKRASGPW